MLVSAPHENPLSRDARIRILYKGYCLMERRASRWNKDSRLTAKMVAVLETMLWQYNNATNYEKLADLAGCTRETVLKAMKAFVKTGLIGVDGEGRRWFRDPGLISDSPSERQLNRVYSVLALHCGSERQVFKALFADPDKVLLIWKTLQGDAG